MSEDIPILYQVMEWLYGAPRGDWFQPAHTDTPMLVVASRWRRRTLRPRRPRPPPPSGDSDRGAPMQNRGKPVARGFRAPAPDHLGVEGAEPLVSLRRGRTQCGHGEYAGLCPPIMQIPA